MFDRILCVGAIAAWATGPALSASLAYSLDTVAEGNQSFAGVLAMDFEVLEDIVVEGLGVFDSGGDGIRTLVTVELWDRQGNTGISILRSRVFQGNTGALQGGHRVLPVTPLRLGEGQYSIVAYGFSAEDPNGNADGFGAFPGDFPWTFDDGNGALKATESRFGGQPGASIGTIPDSRIPPNKYAAGTFLYDLAPIPLPAPVALLVSGIVLLFGCARYPISARNADPDQCTGKACTG